MTEQEYIAHTYHSIFKYQLSSRELKRWRAGERLQVKGKVPQNKFSYRAFPRQHKNSQSSVEKLRIAKETSALLMRIPFVLFVGVTGSLAMNNASRESDIDFMVITTSHTLWISRFLCIFVLLLNHIKLRRAGNGDEQDKICLNLWIDEDALGLPDMPQNIYTAHEVAQVVPLINKDKAYEKWLYKNKWTQGFWPHAVTISRYSSANTKPVSFIMYLNSLFFVVQRAYMKRKITREKITLHYAYFHPFDWGDVVMKELQKRGIVEKV